MFKKNDTVKIIAGKDKGKTGKILQVREGKVIIENINTFKKYMRPKKAGQKGEMVTLSRPIDASNAMLYCSTCTKGVRFGFNMDGDKKVRICRSCKKTI